MSRVKPSRPADNTGFNKNIGVHAMLKRFKEKGSIEEVLYACENNAIHRSWDHAHWESAFDAILILYDEGYFSDIKGEEEQEEVEAKEQLEEKIGDKNTEIESLKKSAEEMMELKKTIAGLKMQLGKAKKSKKKK